VQAGVKTLLGQGNFAVKVLLVARQYFGSKAFIVFAEGSRGGAGQEGAVDVFELIIGTNFSGHYVSPFFKKVVTWPGVREKRNKAVVRIFRAYFPLFSHLIASLFGNFFCTTHIIEFINIITSSHGFSRSFRANFSVVWRCFVGACLRLDFLDGGREKP